MFIIYAYFLLHIFIKNNQSNIANTFLYNSNFDYLYINIERFNIFLFINYYISVIIIIIIIVGIIYRFFSRHMINES